MVPRGLRHQTPSILTVGSLSLHTPHLSKSGQQAALGPSALARRGTESERLFVPGQGPTPTDDGAPDLVLSVTPCTASSCPRHVSPPARGSCDTIPPAPTLVHRTFHPVPPSLPAQHPRPQRFLSSPHLTLFCNLSNKLTFQKAQTVPH